MVDNPVYVTLRERATDGTHEEKLLRQIDNAHWTLDRCDEVWARNYWSTVITTLQRSLERIRQGV